MRDRVRLLGKKGGYTDNPARALAEEPEAVDRDTQDRFTLEAARNWPGLLALQAEVRSEEPLHYRLRRVQDAARTAGIDVHREVRLARLALQAGRSVAHVERRVQVLETRVYHS